MNYQTADSKLQGRNKLSRKIGNNTYLERRNSSHPKYTGIPAIAIRLHGTDIVTFYASGDVELNSGGWKTPTTKQRINEFLEGYSISQDRGVWYVSSYDIGLHSPSRWKALGVFKDHMLISPDGTITGMEPLSDGKKLLKLRKTVNQYATDYIEAFFKGDIPAPGPGDCFYCGLREVKTGKPLGEANRDGSHLLSHIEEKYYVPSLLVNAMQALPHSKVMEWALADKWNNPTHEKSYIPDFTYGQLKKILARYILRQLGQVS